MKKSFLFAAAVALFAACTSDDFSGLAETTPVNPEGYAVGFDAYTGRATTRAGLVGELNLDQIKKSQDEGGGFGVFAYYTDIQKYNKTFMPNFMYNQGVFFNGSKWEYSPLMYWPNEYGSKAQSTDEDKVSFFAYAPFVEEVTSTGYAVGDVTTGITGFSRNSATGDPLVRYVATFDPANAVDLCWGVNDEDSWNTIQNGSQETAAKGLPWLDVEHPEGIDQRMKFTFKHALAQLNVQIDAQVDDNVDLAEGTKIWVRSISFTGISTQGTLNLNNVEANKALWLDYIGVTELACGETVTVKDGRRDGREGANGARVGSELPQGLNPVVVQTETPAAGVTKTAVNLFGTDAALSAPVYVIPTGETMSVTIVYDVETVNPKLPGYISDAVTHGVSVENRITKTIDFGTGEGLDNGKKYTLKLHLGMNSVKLDAEVTDWVEVDGSDAPVPSPGVVNYSFDEFNQMVVANGGVFSAPNGSNVVVTLNESDRSVYNNVTAQFYLGQGTGDQANGIPSLSISNVTFTYNADDASVNLVTGEVYAVAKDISFTNCTFINNSGLSSWGYLNSGDQYPDKMLVSGCTFKDLTGRYGVHQNRARELTVQDCVFENCERGIHTNSPSPVSVVIKNNTFSGLGDKYGVVCLAEGGDYKSATLDISNNSAPGQRFMRLPLSGATNVTLAQMNTIKDNSDNTFGDFYTSESNIPTE